MPDSGEVEALSINQREPPSRSGRVRIPKSELGSGHETPTGGKLAPLRADVDDQAAFRAARLQAPDELDQFDLGAVLPDDGCEFARSVAHPTRPEPPLGPSTLFVPALVWHALAMCNDYRSHVDLDTIRRDFSEIRVRIRFPEGIPNLQPRDDIRITDSGPVLRAGDEPDTVDLVQRRWSWSERGRPVYNFRSEGREFTTGRCLIPTDGFYEFTPHTDPKSKRKHKWLFTMAGQPWFCIAGIWRSTDVGEAFTMLTTAPGPDVAPYHDRQVVVLNRTDWMRWLDPAVSAKDVLKPLPAGSLEVRRVA